MRIERIAAVGVLALVGSVASAHPHFNKTIEVSLPGGAGTLTVTYNTTPANEELAAGVAVGAFATPRGPRLALSSDMTVGDKTLPAGEYTIGVVRKADDDWAMALYPGRLGRGEQPDTSKLIELESEFSTSEGTAHHMLIDVTPGSGAFEGRVVLTLHFGSLFLAGALS